MTPPRTTRDVTHELAEALLDYRRALSYFDRPNYQKDPNYQQELASIGLLQQTIDGLTSELHHMAPEGTHWYQELVAQVESIGDFV
jgi:hypothetical protein